MENTLTRTITLTHAGVRKVIGTKPTECSPKPIQHTTECDSKGSAEKEKPCPINERGFFYVKYR